ncbi:tRNA (guanosine(46)-N7)-methyltransferase TrmB [uncultured Sphaerochaeta sp.]|uniref:tRNA (guanosine(46)-N7)-methyltransferase TrmB n=1 Tax=uncultured Sphaerochaeta sp. TaxID=886478 RepID=UPI002A0A421D|nr:tRNA (guanosine(46)-N7)-methyltransferase TrmB [uncultured Sphaerochaeta sp.]
MQETQDTIFADIPELKWVESREEGSPRGIKSYVLRTSYLRTFQLEAIKKYYPIYGLTFQEEKISFKDIFGNDKPVIIEIGFGMGTSTERIAKERSEYNYLGIEVFLSGFSKLMDQVGKQGLANVRLMRFDAVQVLDSMIVDGSVAGFHVFFPDPWPKKKQQKRRLIQAPLARLLMEKLKEGGYIYCVTDWEEYASQMLSVFSETEGLENPYGGFCPPLSWRPTTKFEQKGLAQNNPINEVWVEKRSFKK